MYHNYKPDLRALIIVKHAYKHKLKESKYARKK